MNASTEGPPVFLLVPGAWHGAWCWVQLQEQLHDRGWDSTALDLPSTAMGSEHRADMYADAGVIRDALAGLNRPVVLVAHSYGGIPATEAAADAENVVEIVYLSAYRLNPGESLLSAGPGVPLPDGDIFVATTEIQQLMFSDLTPAQRKWSAARLGPQSAQAFRDPLTVTPGPDLRSSYIVTEGDQIMPVAFQEYMAARTGVTHHLRAGHSAFLSAAPELADLLGHIAKAYS